MEALHWPACAVILGLRGLFFEADEAPVLIHLNDAELSERFSNGNLNRADGDVPQRSLYAAGAFWRSYFVNVIAAQNEDVLRAFAADGINVLINGVRGAAIPLFADAHLRRKNFDDSPRPTMEDHPARRTAEAERLVLRENENAAEMRVDAIGESESMMRYAAPKGTAGLARSRVSGQRRSP